VIPRVSIILAVRNEERSLPMVLKSLLEQTFSDFELIACDGQSSDGTRKILEEAAKGDSRLRVLDNPYRFKSHGLNEGIRQAKGDVLVIVDGHAAPAPDFLLRNLEALAKTGADGVGGLVIPLGRTFLQRCFTAVLSSWFGSGGARFRSSHQAGVVDTVPYGAYPKSVFQRVGFFQEDLVRNMDIEFNARLRRAGGHLYFDPAIQTNYQVRLNLSSFLSQAYGNGAWNIKTTYLVPGSLSWRHFIPLAFVFALLVATILSILLPPWGWLGLFIVLIPYALLDLFFSAQDSRKLGAIFTLPVLFGIYPLFHFSYGWGSLVSLLTFPLWRKTTSRSRSK